MNGITRRQVIQAGVAGAASLSLADILRLRAQARNLLQIRHEIRELTDSNATHALAGQNDTPRHQD